MIGELAWLIFNNELHCMFLILEFTLMNGLHFSCPREWKWASLWTQRIRASCWSDPTWTWPASSRLLPVSTGRTMVSHSNHSLLTCLNQPIYRVPESEIENSAEKSPKPRKPKYSCFIFRIVHSLKISKLVQTQLKPLRVWGGKPNIFEKCEMQLYLEL